MGVTALALATILLAATPRVSFVRTLPAPHDLGDAEQLAVVYAIGDTVQVTTFVDVFAEHTNDTGMMRVEDATRSGLQFMGDKANVAEARKLQQAHPADAYVGVKNFTCRATSAGGDTGAKDVDGKRIRRRRVWFDAVCEARVDVLSPVDLRRIVSFQVKGEGSSPRVTDLTSEERDQALAQAARYAALAASEQLTPRRIRESIVLDETAPRFADGAMMIEADRLTDARAVWEEALRKHRGSAALHYNLAAVCEAIGDLPAARRHFERARDLSPAEKRYRVEYDLFLKRRAPGAGER
ncbi:MAG TPA: tetratricopeptide repeat protein [Thermoanaerobaculia bacterium]